MKKIMIVMVALLLISSVSTMQTAYAGPVRPVTRHVYNGQSIQAVLDSANAGDTIIVHGGVVYHQSVVISKSISLVGDGAILDGTPPANSYLATEAITIAVGVSGVTIKRFEIRNYVNGIQAWNDGTRNINILGNVIHDVSEAGVNVGNEGTGSHENWFINGNTVRDGIDGIYVSQGKRVVISGNTIGQSKWSGIWVGVQPDSTLDSEGVTVTGNAVTNALVAGIYVLSSSSDAQLKHIAITRNTVSGCPGDGIDILRGSEQARLIEDVVVSYNTVDNNEGVGILLQGVSRGQVSANTVTNQMLHSGIVLVDSSKITVAGNVVRNSRNDGIEINSSNDNTVTGNVVSGNTWGIVLVEGSSQNVIMSNRAKGNAQYDLFDDGTGTGNLWRLNSYDTKNW